MRVSWLSNKIYFNLKGSAWVFQATQGRTQGQAGPPGELEQHGHVLAAKHLEHSVAVQPLVHLCPLLTEDWVLT